MEDGTAIDPDAPRAATLDFRALLQEGIAACQRLGSAHWTDYNEHDPGVTILEHLCFALTDLGYRTSHPMGDILASSMKKTGATPEDQPLYSGPDVLTTTAITEGDYRKLIYDRVSNVRNVWLHNIPREDGGAAGLYHVFIQPYPPVPRGDGTDALIWPDCDQILADVQALMTQNRNLGEDVHGISIVPSLDFAIEAVIEASSVADLNGVVAQMLFKVEMGLNPPPEISDVDEALHQGVDPARIFDGPRLEMGIVSDALVRALGRDVPVELVLQSMLSVDGVERVSRMEIQSATLRKGVTLGAGDKGFLERMATASVSRRASDIAKIHVVRGGVPVSIDANKVLSHLRHMEEKLRWDVTYATRRMKDTTYARVALGNPNRNLDRYRSVQHLFPSVYGIGQMGAGGDLFASGDGAVAVTRKETREARARQLKAYLLFFEQVLADYLAQLNHTAAVFSLKAPEQTYHTQPLARAEPDGDAPHDVAAVLGAALRDKGGLLCRDDNWHALYVARLRSVGQAADNVAERSNRMLDHLLARFNEGFATTHLKRLYEHRSDPPERFSNWVAEQKRAFMGDIVALTGRRSCGWDVSAPKETPLHKRIRLKSGLQTAFFVLEHVLLRSAQSPPGIGALAVASDLYVATPSPVHAVKVTTDAGVYHWILHHSHGRSEWPGLARELARLGAEPGRYDAYPPGAYQVSISLSGMGAHTIEVLENAGTHGRATRAIADMAQACQDVCDGRKPMHDVLRPVLLPTDFFGPSVSVVLAPESQCGTHQVTREQRAFAEDVISSELPAHITPFALWLEPGELLEFQDHFDSWADRAHIFATTPSPSTACQEEKAFAAHRLQLWIHALYCRTIRANREHRRLSLQALSGRSVG